MAESAEPSPHSFVPPRLAGPRDSGDGWVEDGTGRKFWGRFGAAGLLAHDPARGILLQHRANWSHFGGTWGLPGGAKHAGETAVDGAFREAHEEAGVPSAALSLAFTSALDLGFWSYTTVIASVTAPFEAAVADAESIEIRWVPVDEVAALPLHPGFGAAWPDLRDALERPMVLIVDSANVVGSRPTGWWKDRLGATQTFASRLRARLALGFTGESLGLALPGTRWWPETTLIVEGQARGAAAGGDGAGDAVGAAQRDAQHTETHQLGAALRVVAAERDGDQAIVDAVASAFAPAGATRTEGGGDGTSGTRPRVLVVTADRELSARVEALGARVLRPGWLWALLDEL